MSKVSLAIVSLPLLALLAACGAIGVPGAQATGCGPYPEQYRDLVRTAMDSRFPDKYSLRSMMVDEPAESSEAPDGGACGWAGRVRAMVAGGADTPQGRRTFCYFVRRGSLTGFAEAGTAAWCPATDR